MSDANDNKTRTDGPIRFTLSGYGWRGQQIAGIARLLPERFSLVAVYMRDPARAAALARETGLHVVTDRAAILDCEADFDVLALPAEVAADWIDVLSAEGRAVLSETPPAWSREGLSELLDLCRARAARVQIMEQYLMQPQHQANLALIRQGYLGRVSNVRLSLAHGYHGISLIRNYLGVRRRACSISGERFHFPVVVNEDRSGIDYSRRQLRDAERRYAVLRFASGEVGFFDFSGEQYHNRLRSRHLTIQGELGEISDRQVSWLDAENIARTATIERDDAGPWSDLDGWFLRGLRLGGEYFYQNPLGAIQDMAAYRRHAPAHWQHWGPGQDHARLNDDELAMAVQLLTMADYAAGGQSGYSLAEASWDSLISLALDEALDRGETVHVVPEELGIDPEGDETQDD